MSDQKHRKPWIQPWSYREGTMITAAILLLGFMMQAASGGMVLRFAGFPWNLFAGLFFMAVLVAVFVFWKKQPFVKWLGGVNAA